MDTLAYKADYLHEHWYPFRYCTIHFHFAFMDFLFVQIAKICIISVNYNLLFQVVRAFGSGWHRAFCKGKRDEITFRNINT